MAGNSDIQRLVYPPKVWVFVKTANGETLDLTDYVISGEVVRRIGAASTASLVLRNPNHLFTAFSKKYATLHPMDPITIYMERFPGRHVQVFTGYLDTTPYLQLIPGPVTIEATCTLKRLEFNWFQLAQQYTLSFFEHFGWKLIGEGEAGGIIPVNQGPYANKQFEEEAKKKWAQELAEGKRSQSEVEQKEKSLKEEEKEAEDRAKKATAAQGASPNTNTPNPFSNPLEAGNGTGGKPQVIGDDGSFKKLLWAILYYMADWKDENIYIEEIPPGVPELIAALWADFNSGERQEGLKDLKAFWSAIIGVGAKGSGGGAGNPANKGGSTKTGDLTGLSEIIETMSQTAEKYGLPAKFVITTSLCECSFNQAEITSKNSDGATGWFQFTSSEPYPGIKVNYPSDAEDTGLATAAFCQAAVTKGNALAGGKGLPPESEWQHWAEETQVAGNGAYDPSWSRCEAQAEGYLQQYKPKKAEGKEGGSTSERGKVGEGETNKTSSSSKTRIKAMEEEADTIDSLKYPYSYGGGHASAGRPSIGPEHENGEGPMVLGFDCSGSVGAVLAAGGFVPENSAIPASGGFSGLNIPGWSAGESTSSPSVNVFFNETHAWMTINGRYFSTGWNDNPKSGAGWGTTNHAEQPEPRDSYTVMHLSTASLEQTYTGHKPPTLTGEPGSPAEKLVGETESSNVMGTATAASFLSQIAAPNAEERLLADAIGGQRALMNTTPVLDLVEQVCQSSLRSFMSLPNGDFYAFYPDYFGEFGHHEPYWAIKNIEVQSGTVELTDSNLITHYFAVGDVSWPGTVTFINDLYAGAMTVYEAFQPGILLHNEKPATKGNEPEKGRANGNTNAAIAFLKRYGARPAKHEYNMVFSALFDQLLAYQQFLLGWSRQFQSSFHFTFMPELFPGGKVAFPETGIKMYVEEVTHAWDITDTGYETSAVLSAPSIFRNTENTEAINELPENMVEALIEPLRNQIGKPTKPTEPPHTPTSPIIKTREEARNKAFGPGIGLANTLVE